MQWRLVDAAIDAMSWENPETVTARTMLIWLRWSGARRAEFHGASTEDLSLQQDAAGAQWMFWKVRGKGDTVREVPLSAAMLAAYAQYSNTMGYVLGGRPLGSGPARPLFEMPGRTPHSPRRAATGFDLYSAVRDLAELAASTTTTAFDRQRILALTPHWFRHRRAFELQRTESLATAAQLLGHENLNTTLVYSNAAAIDLARRLYPDGLAPQHLFRKANSYDSRKWPPTTN